MKLLTRAQVLAAKDLSFEDVSCPEWAPEGTPEEEKNDFGLRIRNLTGDGRGVFIQQSLKIKEAEDDGKKADFKIEMLLIAMTAIDEEGKQLFTEDDVAELGTKNAAPVSRCANVASRLSGITKAAKEQAAKN